MAADDEIIDFGEDFGKVRFVGDDVVESSAPIKFNPIETQPSTAGPNMEDLRARFVDGDTPSVSDPEVNPSAKKMIETMRAEKEAKKNANDLARPATREAIEKEGYLYHFAPNKYSENIAEKGLVSNIDPRAPQGAGKIFYWTDPSHATTGGFAPETFKEGGTLDLYRTKVTPEMLDSFQMDPLIGNKDGVAKSVFFEADSFPAEKIGVGGVYDESTGGIKYQKLGHHSPEEIAGRHPSHRKPQPKPVTKRVGPTPPESGTTLKNVGKESVTVGRTGRLTTSAETAKKMDDAANKKITEFTSDPEKLYRKFLGHVGDIKREGGILDERLGSGVRNLDPNDIRVAAINRLGMETGLVEDAGKYDSHGALSKIRHTLETNKTFADQAILDEAKVSGRNVVVGGRSLKDLQKENPGKSIDELIDMNKRQQVEIMNPGRAHQPEAFAARDAERKEKAERRRERRREQRLRHGKPVDSTTEAKPIVPKVDDTVSKATAETAAEVAHKSPPIPSPVDSTKRASNTTKKISESLDAAKKAVKGHTNARGLLFAGAASILGVGLYQRNRQTRIEPDEYYH